MIDNPHSLLNFFTEKNLKKQKSRTISNNTQTVISLFNIVGKRLLPISSKINCVIDSGKEFFYINVFIETENLKCMFIIFHNENMNMAQQNNIILKILSENIELKESKLPLSQEDLPPVAKEIIDDLLLKSIDKEEFFLLDSEYINRRFVFHCLNLSTNFSLDYKTSKGFSICATFQLSA